MLDASLAIIEKKESNPFQLISTVALYYIGPELDADPLEFSHA